MRSILALPLVALAMPVLADSRTVTPGNSRTTPPEAWLGAAPHLVIMGQVGDHVFDVQVMGESAAALEAKREYLPDGADFRYGDFEIAYAAVIDGVEKAIELEFENADFASHPLPADFTLQGEAFPEGLLSNLEVQFEWEADGISVNEEVAGWSGILTRTEDSGTPDEQGLVPDGMIGGFVSATGPAGTLVVSFLVPVAGYEIDD